MTSTCAACGAIHECAPPLPTTDRRVRWHAEPRQTEEHARMVLRRVRIHPGARIGQIVGAVSHYMEGEEDRWYWYVSGRMPRGAKLYGDEPTQEKAMGELAVVCVGRGWTVTP